MNKLGKYQIRRILGQGAMGIVYMAKDNELEETVALKILPDNLSQNPEAGTMLEIGQPKSGEMVWRRTSPSTGIAPGATSSASRRRVGK